MKRILLALLLIILTASTNAQVNLGSIKNREYLKGKTLAVLVSEMNSDYHKKLKEVFDKNWTITPVEYISKDDFRKYRATGKYVFWEKKSYSKSMGGMNSGVHNYGYTMNYFNFYGYKDGSSGEVNFAEIFYLDENYVFLQCYLKNFQQAYTNSYKAESENYDKHKSNLKSLKNDTVYVHSQFLDDTVVVKADNYLYGIKVNTQSKMLSDKKINKQREKLQEFFKDYKYPYKLINSAELNKLVKESNNTKPLYLLFNGMIYGFSGGFFTYVYDANSGDIIYLNKGGVMGRGVMDEDDVKDLGKAISKS